MAPGWSQGQEVPVEVVDDTRVGVTEHVIIETDDEIQRRLCTGCIRCVRRNGGEKAVNPLLMTLGGVKTSRWSYVGSGQGSFEKWNTYNYVGVGVGEFEKELSNKTDWRIKKPCCVVMLILVFPAMVYIVFCASKIDEARMQRRAGMSTPSPPIPPAYNCTEGHVRTKSEEELCCAGGHCSNSSTTSSVVRRSTSSEQLSVQESHEFNCKLGIENWRLSWPDKKKRWCCLHRGAGCLAGMVRASTTTTTTTRPTRAPRTIAPVTPSPALSQPFNCEEGLEKWGKMWHKEKRAWCCKHEGRACDTSTVLPTTTAAPPEFRCLEEKTVEWTRNERKWCCDKHAKGCKPSYDCLKGYFNWKVAWSREKVKWCCEHEERACGKSSDEHKETK